MGTLGIVIYRLVILALVCGVVGSFLPDGTAFRLIRLVSGLAMTLAVLQPLVKLDLHEVSDSLQALVDEGAQQAQAGKDTADDAWRQSIKQQLEAYIWNKAAEAEISVDVELTLSEEELPVPKSAVISGTVTEAQKHMLRQILQEDLGIEEEYIRWTGQNGNSP